ncbi:allene oxide synthase 1, chloroplastic [Dendrobium catenatum]|uniref:Allene oxide synthase 1, chloroplastic n=1 Tax=Dendrobium catenatum TaxID=906689 RepID=A0A2I0W240_9ASPA|nr:allene oxide synthase 1, chloroplastic [Dendrobium catenatum]PKU69729.1 Allene oxide synthase 1, chloroplastic [Dendrobium catenatum]
MAATAAFSTPNSSPRLPLFSYRTTTSFPPFSITIRSSIADRPSTLSANAPPADLPLRKIPGDYGFPLLGSIKDRFAYFYTEGCDAFFRSRIRRYNSTVFRVNMPPGPPISADPRVIALLDAVSFPILFDTSAVEKRDLFTGTFMPSTDLTGGYRVLSYLDPSEPLHAPLKKLLFFLLSHRRRSLIPEFRRAFGSLFSSLESDLSKQGKVDFGPGNDRACFDFLSRALLGRDPADSPLGSDAPGIITKWVLFQIGPLLTIGLPRFIEDATLHSFRLPPALIRADYDRLADFFRESAGPVLDEANRLGISREEAVHNLVFSICFNSFGGMKILFPNIVKWLGRAGGRLHSRLAAEVRAAVRSNAGQIGMRVIEEEMPLVKSVVYEALRIEPPVSMQYGKAKRDLLIRSHDAAFEVKTGEVLFGYQPFATKDPRVFDRAEEFVGDRFVGEEGERLLRHVVWSNGPETEGPTVENKQCAGKDFVVLVARLLVIELFLRYDSFEIEVGSSALGSSVKLTSLKRASF